MEKYIHKIQNQIWLRQFDRPAAKRGPHGTVYFVHLGKGNIKGKPQGLIP